MKDTSQEQPSPGLKDEQIRSVTSWLFAAALKHPRIQRYLFDNNMKHTTFAVSSLINEDYLTTEMINQSSERETPTVEQTEVVLMRSLSVNRWINHMTAQ